MDQKGQIEILDLKLVGKDAEMDDLRRELKFIQDSEQKAKDDLLHLTTELNKLTEEEELLPENSSKIGMGAEQAYLAIQYKKTGLSISDATEFADDLKEFVANLQLQKNTSLKKCIELDEKNAEM